MDSGQPAPGTARGRADAARNRARLLAEARRLFAEHGPANVTTAALAQAAGVSKGTVFHHFGDRAGLAEALLSESESELQDALIRGPSPLGPGADPRTRITAFLAALGEHVDRHRTLLLELDGARPAGRYRTGAFTAWLQHCRMLLDEMGVARPHAVAHVLLAPLSADLAEHLRADAGRSLDEVVAALVELVGRLDD